MGRTFSRVLTVFLLCGGVTLAGCMAFKGRHRDGGPSDAVISSYADARWTATTLEAASTPQHRKVLAGGRPMTITGEVIDVSCFLQLGKRGEAHIACGQKCVRNGQPIGVLTDAGRLYLIIPEEHHPRRDGQGSIKDRFAELMGKQVRASGMVTKYDNYRALFVRTLPTEQ